MNLTVFLSHLFPFKGIKPVTLKSITDNYIFEIKNFSKNDIIFSPNSFKKEIGFIISGECEVEKERISSEPLRLNLLTKYTSFGITSVFSDEPEFPTVIKAKKKASVLFISAEEFIAITKKYPTIAMNIISFLIDRINFLNKKIQTFTGKTVDEKVASYLLNMSKKYDEIPLSGTKISNAVNVGRASVYRTLECFSEKGLIKINDKKIIILAPKELERISK